MHIRICRNIWTALGVWSSLNILYQTMLYDSMLCHSIPKQRLESHSIWGVCRYQHVTCYFGVVRHASLKAPVTYKSRTYPKTKAQNKLLRN